MGEEIGRPRVVVPASKREKHKFSFWNEQSGKEISFFSLNSSTSSLLYIVKSGKSGIIKLSIRGANVTDIVGCSRR